MKRGDSRHRHSRALGVLSLIWLASLAGCTTVSVSIDHAADADFSRLSTWRWHAEPTPRPDLPGFDEVAFDRSLRAVVERELAAKGYLKKDAAPTDFEVGYHTAVEAKTDYQGTRDYYGYRSGGPVDHHFVDEYLEGTLLLDVSLDQGSRLIWRGQAQARVFTQGTAAERLDRLDEAVNRMLAGFPP